VSCNGDDRTNTEGFGNALQSGKKKPVGSDRIQGPASNTYLAKTSPDALQARY
jgi:hypothetical protein